eukprot:6477691-Amphidinium_carterae.2
MCLAKEQSLWNAQVIYWRSQEQRRKKNRKVAFGTNNVISFALFVSLHLILGIPSLSPSCRIPFLQVGSPIWGRLWRQELCGDFKRGVCTRGDRCRFSHVEGGAAEGEPSH